MIDSKCEVSDNNFFLLCLVVCFNREDFKDFNNSLVGVSDIVSLWLSEPALKSLFLLSHLLVKSLFLVLWLSALS